MSHFSKEEPVRVPKMPKPPRDTAPRTMARAHTVDAAWNRLLRDTETIPAFIAKHATQRVHNSAFIADGRRLVVQCRRHTASVYRKLDNAFPPYSVIAAKVAHP